MSSASSATPPITKRACDACHRRKVRCNGANPCQNCVQAALNCTYNKIPQKKGPKGSRAKVITELRKSQEEAAAAAAAARDGLSSLSPISSPSYARSHEFLPSELIDACVHEFFDKTYTTVPVLHRQWCLQKVSEVSRYAESYCVVGALCVFMVSRSWGLLRAVPNPIVAGVGKQQAILLCSRIVDDVKRMRSQTDYAENPTISTILTSFFLSGALFDIERTNSSWFYLQEAITFAKMVQIHTEETYGSDIVLDTMNRRLFWVLFITERAQALHKHRDILLSETIDFPEPEPGDVYDEMAINGLSCLYHLFRTVDESFSNCWRSLRASTQVIWPANTNMWLTGLQTQLSAAIPSGIKLSKTQAPDLHVTQQWLRTQVWLLATASSTLSSTAADESMTLLYPIKISKDLLEILSYSDVASIEIHGVGIIEKIFDIAYSLADVLTLEPVEANTYEVGPREFLSTFLQYISALRNGETKYLGLLQAKIRDVQPALANSLGIPAQPPQRPSTHSSTTSSQTLPTAVSRMEAEASSRASPYQTSASLASGSSIGSSALQFPMTGHAEATAASNTDPNLTNPSNSRERGLSEGLGPPASHPYHYSSGAPY